MHPGLQCRGVWAAGLSWPGNAARVLIPKTRATTSPLSQHHLHHPCTLHCTADMLGHHHDLLPQGFDFFAPLPGVQRDHQTHHKIKPENRYATDYTLDIFDSVLPAPPSAYLQTIWMDLLTIYIFSA